MSVVDAVISAVEASYEISFTAACFSTVDAAFGESDDADKLTNSHAYRSAVDTADTDAISPAVESTVSSAICGTVASAE